MQLLADIPTFVEWVLLYTHHFAGEASEKKEEKKGSYCADESARLCQSESEWNGMERGRGFIHFASLHSGRNMLQTCELRDDDGQLHARRVEH